MSKAKLLKVSAAVAMLMLMLCAPALAKVVSPGADFYYLDQAGVLSQELEGEIFFSNKLLYDACGAQIVVVTVDTTGRQAIDDYAYDLFNEWGIGDAAKNNGFLLLLAIEDEDYYARTGSGLDGRFSAATIKEYYDKYLEDDFAAEKYEAGVKKFFEAVFKRISTTYSADVTTAQGIADYKAYIAANSAAEGFGGYNGSRRNGAYNEDYRSYDRDNDSGSGFWLVVALIVIILLVVVLSKGRRARQRARVLPPPPVTPPIIIGRPSYGPTRRSSVGFGGPPPRSSGSSRSTFGGGSSRSVFGGGGGSSRSSSSAGRSSFGGSSRSSSSFRSSSGFGGGRSGGGRTSGGGAGRGRH